MLKVHLNNRRCVGDKFQFANNENTEVKGQNRWKMRLLLLSKSKYQKTSSCVLKKNCIYRINKTRQNNNCFLYNVLIDRVVFTISGFTISVLSVLCFLI